jgi:type II restriction enzyme
MNLALDYSNTGAYSSLSQKARIVTEMWAQKNMFCPICGKAGLRQHPANRPVADFFCELCGADYELKSKNKNGNLSTKIIDGAYETMIDRISSNSNVNLFYMQHDTKVITDLVLIPSFFFTPQAIEKRPPLKTNVRRAGWVGCNINLNDIPSAGKIFIVKQGICEKRQEIHKKYLVSKQLQTNEINNRSWLMDILLCVENLQKEFLLVDIYQFENGLKQKHPNNLHVKDKIRQQLQILRNKGFIEFLGNGKYRKTGDNKLWK